MARMLWTFDLALDETTHPDDVATTTSSSSTTTTGATDMQEGEDGKHGEQGPGEWQEKQRVFLIWEKRPLMVKLSVREGINEGKGESESSGGGQAGGFGAAGSGSGSGVMPMGSNVAESVACSA